jgi:hypothetical protein
MADVVITQLINIPSDRIVTTPEATKTLTSGKLVKAGAGNTLLDSNVFADGTSTKIGNATNNSEFEADGTMKFNGNATVFDDMLGDITRTKTVGTRVTLDDTENTLNFTSSAALTDYVFINFQMPHRWKVGTTLYPHIHWEQNANNVPNWLIQYRWQINGSAKTTAWTNYKCNTSNAFTYVSGVLNQISYGGGLTPPVGAGLSDIIEIRLIRDTSNTSTVFTGSDPYSGTASVTTVDIHYQIDTLGSRTEYSK